MSLQESQAGAGDVSVFEDVKPADEWVARCLLKMRPHVGEKMCLVNDRAIVRGTGTGCGDVLLDQWPEPVIDRLAVPNSS